MIGRQDGAPLGPLIADESRGGSRARRRVRGIAGEVIAFVLVSVLLPVLYDRWQELDAWIGEMRSAGAVAVGSAA